MIVICVPLLYILVSLLIRSQSVAKKLTQSISDFVSIDISHAVDVFLQPAYYKSHDILYIKKLAVLGKQNSSKSQFL